MAGRPKETKVKAILAKFAQQELGQSARGTDFVGSWVESGRTITELAKKLVEEMGESCSRSFLATVINRNPEDKQRITAARAEAAHVLIDQALPITDEPALSTVDVQRNRLRAETRAKIAGWWNRQEYGEAKPAAVQIDIGKLHIEAIRALTAKRLSQINTLPAEATPNAADVGIVGPADVLGGADRRGAPARQAGSAGVSPAQGKLLPSREGHARQR